MPEHTVWLVWDRSDYYVERLVGVFSTEERAEAGLAHYQQEYERRITKGRPVWLDLWVGCETVDQPSIWMDYPSSGYGPETEPREGRE